MQEDKKCIFNIRKANKIPLQSNCIINMSYTKDDIIQTAIEYGYYDFLDKLLIFLNTSMNINDKFDIFQFAIIIIIRSYCSDNFYTFKSKYTNNREQRIEQFNFPNPFKEIQSSDVRIIKLINQLVYFNTLILENNQNCNNKNNNNKNNLNLCKSIKKIITLLFIKYNYEINIKTIEKMFELFNGNISMTLHYILINHTDALLN